MSGYISHKDICRELYVGEGRWILLFVLLLLLLLLMLMLVLLAACELSAVLLLSDRMLGAERMMCSVEAWTLANITKTSQTKPIYTQFSHMKNSHSKLPTETSQRNFCTKHPEQINLQNWHILASAP